MDLALHVLMLDGVYVTDPDAIGTYLTDCYVDRWRLNSYTSWRKTDIDALDEAIQQDWPKTADWVPHAPANTVLRPTPIGS